MGVMFLFIIGIFSIVGLSLYQFSEQSRFEMVSDLKNGGVFIIDKKASSLNYCDNKTCSLVGRGYLPSQIMNNPTALASLQNAIMGAPASAVALKPGQAPEGMQDNIASASVDADEETQNADENADTKDKDHEDDSLDDASEEKAPEGFDF